MGEDSLRTTRRFEARRQRFDGRRQVQDRHWHLDQLALDAGDDLDRGQSPARSRRTPSVSASIPRANRGADSGRAGRCAGRHQRSPRPQPKRPWSTLPVVVSGRAAWGRLRRGTMYASGTSERQPGSGSDERLRRAEPRRQRVCGRAASSHATRRAPLAAARAASTSDSSTVKPRIFTRQFARPTCSRTPSGSSRPGSPVRNAQASVVGSVEGLAVDRAAPVPGQSRRCATRSPTGRSRDPLLVLDQDLHAVGGRPANRLPPPGSRGRSRGG
jgi:hypothetical protein